MKGEERCYSLSDHVLVSGVEASAGCGQNLFLNIYSNRFYHEKNKLANRGALGKI